MLECLFLVAALFRQLSLLLTLWHLYAAFSCSLQCGYWRLWASLEHWLLICYRGDLHRDCEAVCYFVWQTIVRDCWAFFRFPDDCWPLSGVLLVRRVYVKVEYPAHVHVKLDHGHSCALPQHRLGAWPHSFGPWDNTVTRHNSSTVLMLKECLLHFRNFVSNN